MLNERYHIRNGMHFPEEWVLLGCFHRTACTLGNSNRLLKKPVI